MGPMLSEVRSSFPGISSVRQGHETKRRVITQMVSDLVSETQVRLLNLGPRSAQEIREQDSPVVSFSAGMIRHNHILKKFLFDNMYRHHRVNRMASKARRVVKSLFTLFLEEPECHKNSAVGKKN